MRITDFDTLPIADAHAHVMSCCAAPRWADRLVAARPFESLAALRARASEMWAEAEQDELLEAYAAHPVLGDVEYLRARFQGPAMSEQGQVLDADDAVLEALAQANRLYLERFGFIFILCARGVSAAGMLSALRARIDNDRDTEIANAAREQGSILDQRLCQLFAEESD